jgi:serine/threonine protein phosphatase PrpC
MTISQPLRIFVSHSSKDNDFGIQLAEDLRHVLGDDTAVWYDTQGGLELGDTWWDKIVEQVTARDVFIIVLSPDAMDSKWVRREFNMAFNQEKLIVPLRYRSCKVWADLNTIQSLSFLPPKNYDDAFKELLKALGLPVQEGTRKIANQPADPGTAFVQQMMPQIEEAFVEQDWPAVIYKTDFLIKQAPSAISSTIYCMQGRALFEEDEKQRAQEAFKAALALASDRPQRLAALGEYTTLLGSLGQWDEVLRKTREALRLVPDNLNWLVWQATALLQLGRNEEARTTYERARTLNPNDAGVQALASTLAKIYPPAPSPQPSVIRQPQRKQNILSLIALRAADRTDVGKVREQNEDCGYKRIESSETGDCGLFIVADGEGGYRRGDVASRLAVEYISKVLDHLFKPLPDQPSIKHLVEDQLINAIKQANKGIISYGERQPSARGLGCTVTTALLQDDRAYIANVGNSRTYLLRNGELKALTKDHSLVAKLVEAKQIEPEEVYAHPQRHDLYRSLGAGHKTVEVDVFQEPMQAGDTLLLCSDGLWEMVRDQEIKKVLSEESDPQKICNKLIAMANENGGEDNITAIVVQVSTY